DNTALVWMIVKLGLDVVIGSAFAVAVLLCRIFRIRIAALNHEFLDDPMENRAVVKTLSRKLFEILDRIWCRIGPKLQDHIAFAGLDYCDFVGCIHLRFFLLLLFPAKYDRADQCNSKDDR